MFRHSPCSRAAANWLNTSNFWRIRTGPFHFQLSFKNKSPQGSFYNTRVSYGHLSHPPPSLPPPPHYLCHYISPTPLTTLRQILVPCLNSSFEFSLVAGSRWAILTPSWAFLLWGCLKYCTGFIVKCKNIGMSIFPPCFSIMCFHRGLSEIFFATSRT